MINNKLFQLLNLMDKKEEIKMGKNQSNLFNLFNPHNHKNQSQQIEFQKEMTNRKLVYQSQVALQTRRMTTHLQIKRKRLILPTLIQCLPKM